MEEKSRIVVFELELGSDFDDINQPEFRNRLISMIPEHFNPKIRKQYREIL